MKKMVSVVLAALVLTTWSCQEDDDKLANTLTFNTETCELSSGALIIGKRLEGADYHYISLQLYSPPWSGSPMLYKHSINLMFTSSTPDLAEGSYAIISPLEWNGQYKPGLAMPGSLLWGLSVDVTAGSAIHQFYNILKGSVQVKKSGDTYNIEFEGEASTNMDRLPIRFSYTGILAKEIRG